MYTMSKFPHTLCVRGTTLVCTHKLCAHNPLKAIYVKAKIVHSTVCASPFSLYEQAVYV